MSYAAVSDAEPTETIAGPYFLVSTYSRNCVKPLKFLDWYGRLITSTRTPFFKYFGKVDPVEIKKPWCSVGEAWRGS